MAGYGIRSFLVAQSLNQIEKAYGQNNAILDNCHVRVSFAANDERTAKRLDVSRRIIGPNAVVSRGRGAEDPSAPIRLDDLLKTATSPSPSTGFQSYVETCSPP